MDTLQGTWEVLLSFSLSWGPAVDQALGPEAFVYLDSYTSKCLEWDLGPTDKTWGSPFTLGVVLQGRKRVLTCDTWRKLRPGG